MTRTCFAENALKITSCMVAERNGRKFTVYSVCDQEKGVPALYIRP